MRIGIDFDDTLVKTSEKVKEYMNKYNIKKFNNFKEQEKFYKEHLDEITKNLELKENVIEVLNELSKTNELYLITARNKNELNITKEYIKKNKFPFKDMFFDYFGIGKLNKCLELNIDLFIDDDLINVSATNKLIKTIYFNGNDKNYLCLNNWNDILKEVNKWKKE